MSLRRIWLLALVAFACAGDTRLQEGAVLTREASAILGLDHTAGRQPETVLWVTDAAGALSCATPDYHLRRYSAAGADIRILSIGHDRSGNLASFLKDRRLQAAERVVSRRNARRLFGGLGSSFVVLLHADTVSYAGPAASFLRDSTAAARSGS